MYLCKCFTLLGTAMPSYQPRPVGNSPINKVVPPPFPCSALKAPANKTVLLPQSKASSHPFGSPGAHWKVDIFFFFLPTLPASPVRDVLEKMKSISLFLAVGMCFPETASSKKHNVWITTFPSPSHRCGNRRGLQAAHGVSVPFS